MTTAAPLNSKIPTKSPQLRPVRVKTKSRKRLGGQASEHVIGTSRESTRGDGLVVEVAGGVTVYPARELGDRWRAVWYEGRRRRQCESVSEAGLAARLVKVTERLTADRPWYDEQRPEPFAIALRAAKAALDPKAILNPGALIVPCNMPARSSCPGKPDAR